MPPVAAVGSADGLLTEVMRDRGYPVDDFAAQEELMSVDHPEVVENAREAIRRAGVKLEEYRIRGGTDGSILSELGLPTPNLFAGYHNPHGPQEWGVVQEMEQSLQMCLNLLQLWEQKGNGYKGRPLKKKRGAKARR